MISFIARQYYRLNQGAGLLGLPMNSLLWLAAQYGIYRAFLNDSGISFFVFLPVGLIMWVTVYWAFGFAGDMLGLFKEYQSHMNRENNPEWVDAYAKICRIAEKVGVE